MRMRTFVEDAAENVGKVVNVIAKKKANLPY